MPVKIIAGSLKGRSIVFPDIAGLRPTLSRVRETMFAWVGDNIYEANCLDLFAGSGAMGFEAVSRGANRVIMVEQDLAAVEHLKTNKLKLNINNLTIIANDYNNSELIKKFAPFDLVFLDPPFAGHGLIEALKWLDDNALLAKNALCLCEWCLQIKPNFTNMFETIRLKKAGNVSFGLLQYQNMGK